MNVADAAETLKILKECAQEAGIYKAWFISFGTLLGCVRGAPNIEIVRKGAENERRILWKRGPMPKDHDMDVGILADKITREQEFKYVELLQKKGMFSHRKYETHNQRRSDTDRHVWFSVRKNKSDNGGTKCCHWCWQPYQGWYWHGKGKGWVKESKVKQNVVRWEQSDEAVMLGIDRRFIETLVEVDFCGGHYNIPQKFGMCLDWWYPEWHVLRGGSSTKQMFLVVKEWKNEKSYRIVQG